MTALSLRGRLTFLHGAVIGLSLVVFAASALWLTGHVLLVEETRALEATARQIGADMDEDGAEHGDLLAAVQDALEEEPPSDTRISVYDAGGDLIGSTDAPRADSPAVAAPPPSDEQRHHERFVSAHGLVVDASIAVASRSRSMAVLARALALTGIPLLIIAVFVERLITTRALHPLEDVARRASSASAEAGVRSIGEPVGIDEVDRLTAAFNRLLTTLDDARRLERRFTADASHELRTPLTVLLGELELARSSLAPGIPATDSIAAAGAQARRMSDLVDALLLLRRLNEDGRRLDGDFEAVNLADVVREVCQAQIDARPDRAGDLRVIAPDEIFVAGHPSLLASAMTNLVDNALKFTRRGEGVEVVLEAAAGEVRVVVTDAGRGIRPEDVDRLFDPFYRGAQARSETQGFGLGLPILRQVARAHGGDVTCRSAPSGGACFVLRLPPWSGSRPGSPPLPGAR